MAGYTKDMIYPWIVKCKQPDRTAPLQYPDVQLRNIVENELLNYTSSTEEKNTIYDNSKCCEVNIKRTNINAEGFVLSWVIKYNSPLLKTSKIKILVEFTDPDGEVTTFRPSSKSAKQITIKGLKSQVFYKCDFLVVSFVNTEDRQQWKFIIAEKKQSITLPKPVNSSYSNVPQNKSSDQSKKPKTGHKQNQNALELSKSKTTPMKVEVQNSNSKKKAINNKLTVHVTPTGRQVQSYNQGTFSQKNVAFSGQHQNRQFNNSPSRATGSLLGVPPLMQMQAQPATGSLFGASGVPPYNNHNTSNYARGLPSNYMPGMNTDFNMQTSGFNYQPSGRPFQHDMPFRQDSVDVLNILDQRLTAYLNSYIHSSYIPKYQGTRYNLSIPQILSLEEKAHNYIHIPSNHMVPIMVLYRNKPKGYFEDIFRNHFGVMRPYEKDFNGDPGCPINGNIEGLFFSGKVNPDNDKLPEQSPFGNRRFILPVSRIFNRSHNLYFADFYCNNKYKDPHYVTIVVTKPGSFADLFCRRNLPELNKHTNPYLRVTMYKGNDFIYITQMIWVEILYTENVDLNLEMQLYDGAFTTVPVIGKGSSTAMGIPKNPKCALCNL